MSKYAFTVPEAPKHPSSAGGNKLKRAVNKKVSEEPNHTLKKIANDIPPETWDRLHDIISGKVTYDH